ncbi:hypothetical protein [Mycobacteroides abscessus]|uniref:hypothetical protein n=1 Tax=Mycobacteroides abscessus TaxID=36809 RepID=UPI001F1D4536|nr:hypothetical protein [Mycobacteroides abscessus]
MAILEPSRLQLALPPLSPPWDRFDIRLNRSTRKQVATIAATVAVRTATVDAVTDVQQVKIDAVAAAGERAMLRAALLGQVQQQLVLACPASSGDMDVLKTITTISMGQVVADTAAKVARL